MSEEKTQPAILGVRIQYLMRDGNGGGTAWQTLGEVVKNDGFKEGEFKLSMYKTMQPVYSDEDSSKVVGYKQVGPVTYDLHLENDRDVGRVS